MVSDCIRTSTKSSHLLGHRLLEDAHRVKTLAFVCLRWMNWCRSADHVERGGGEDEGAGSWVSRLREPEPAILPLKMKSKVDKTSVFQALGSLSSCSSGYSQTLLPPPPPPKLNLKFYFSPSKFFQCIIILLLLRWEKTELFPCSLCLPSHTTWSPNTAVLFFA